LIAAVPAGVVLIASARSGLAIVASAIYATSLVALYGASSAYHRLGRTVRSQKWLRRLDHASIYVLIAGSYTPICLLVLKGHWRWSLLAGVWLAAAVGVVLKLARFDVSSRIGGALYIVMGWAVIVAAPALVSRLPAGVLVLFALGGLMYTGGAIILARRRPNPAPRVFGYHEVWHVLVVAAGVCHYAAIYNVVTGV
jgi:hemolysin III